MYSQERHNQSYFASSFKLLYLYSFFCILLQKKERRKELFFHSSVGDTMPDKMCCETTQKKRRGNNQNIQTQTHWQEGWSLNDHFLLAVVRILLQTRLLLSIVTTPNTNFQTKMKKWRWISIIPTPFIKMLTKSRILGQKTWSFFACFRSFLFFCWKKKWIPVVGRKDTNYPSCG